MDLKKRIFEALREAGGPHPGIILEELAKDPCPVRMDFIAKGVSEDTGRHTLRRMADLGVVQMISNYLEHCYGTRFVPGAYYTLDNITTHYVGELDGVPIDVAVVASEDYNQSKPADYLLMSSAYKTTYIASTRDYSHSILLTIDRDKQEWASFLLGETSEIRQTAEKMSIKIQDFSDGLGVGERHCGSCEFRDQCPVRGRGQHIGKKPTIRTIPEPRITKELDAYLRSLNEKPNGRTKGVIHPSEISTSECDRFIAYGLLSTDEQESIDPKLRRIFDTGHVFHDVIQSALSWAYETFRSEVRISDAELRIAGSCDGDWPDLRKGIEIKSIGANGYKDLRSAKSDHKEQATIYGVKLSLEEMLYCYVCKGLTDIAVFQVPIDKKIWHRVAARASKIVKTVDEGSMPPPITGKDYICGGCKYQWTCKPELSKKKTRSFKR